VKVSYRIAAGKLTAVVDRPADLPGEFVWGGKSYPLEMPRTRLVLGL
jgi:hypothetical protein